jgi:hypothetical protein
VGLVHVVAVPTVVAVEGVAARPGHHVLVEVAPGVERCREAQPARRRVRRARVAPREALLLLEQIHADVVKQPHPLAGVVVDLGVDLDVEPGRQLWRQTIQGSGEQDPAEIAPGSHGNHSPKGNSSAGGRVPNQAGLVTVGSTR